jgi:hypothetical protein
VKPFRDELEAAHARIAQLEKELKEAREPPKPPAPPPAPVEVRSPVSSDPTPPARLAWWEWWPLPLLLACFVTYLARFGLTLPGGLADELGSGDTVVTRWRIVVVVLGGALYVGDLVIRARTGGRTVLSRLLLVLAAIVVAPVAIPAGFAALTVGGVAFGFVMSGAMALTALWMVVKWIFKGKTD